MARAWGDPRVCLGRELTKLHEEVLRGTASSVAALLGKRPGVKGEIAVAAAPSEATAAAYPGPGADLGEDTAPEGGADAGCGPDDDAGAGE